MKRFILQEYSPEERQQLLNDNFAKEKITFTRHLTEAEIDAEAKNLANVTMEINRTEEEKRMITKVYGDRITGMKEKARAISETLIEGTKEENQECFKVLDIDTWEVGFYDRNGELVRVRPATAQERQMDMFVDVERQKDIIAGKKLLGGPTEQQNQEDEEGQDDDEIQDADLEEVEE